MQGLPVAKRKKSPIPLLVKAGVGSEYCRECDRETAGGGESGTGKCRSCVTHLTEARQNKLEARHIARHNESRFVTPARHGVGFFQAGGQYL